MKTFKDNNSVKTILFYGFFKNGLNIWIRMALNLGTSFLGHRATATLRRCGCVQSNRRD